MIRGTISYEGTNGSLEYSFSGTDINGLLHASLWPNDAESQKFLYPDFDSGAMVVDEEHPTTIVFHATSIEVAKLTALYDGATYEVIPDKENLKRVSAIIPTVRELCTTGRRSSSTTDEDGNFLWEYDISVGTNASGTVILENGNFNHADVTIGGWGLKMYTDTVPSVNNDARIFKESGKSIFKYNPLEIGGIAEYITVQHEDIDPPPLGGFYSLKDIVKANPTKNYSWLLERDYYVVGPDNFEAVCRYLASTQGLVAFDTETTGLDFTFLSEIGMGSQLVGMVFSVQEGESFYFPVAHKNFENITSPDKIDYVLETYFKPLLEQKDIVTFNGSFDWRVMWTKGINTNIVFDVMLAYQLTLANQVSKGSQGFMSLKTMSSMFLDRDSLELRDFVPEGAWGVSDLTFADLDKESTRLYACADSDNTLALARYFIESGVIAKYNAHKVCELEAKMCKVVGYSQYYCLYTNPTRIVELSNMLEKEINSIREQMFAQVGYAFNPASTKELQKVLFDSENGLGIKPSRFTDKGAPSTNKKAMEYYSQIMDEDGNARYPIANLIVEYRQLSNIQSSFIKQYDNMSHEGYISSSVNQLLETGRMSTNGPNYQGFSDTVKKYVVARNGYYMMDMDYSSVESRVMVSAAGEKSLIDEFQNPDFDYHRKMASLLYDLNYEHVTSTLRKRAKSLNFGIPYGMTEVGLTERLFGSVTPQNKRKASELYNKFFEVQPKVKGMFSSTKHSAVSRGYNETYFGRRRYYKSASENKSRIERQAGNHPIQGTAADIFKMGCVRLFDELVKRDYLGKVLIDCFVHDEVVIECHKSINPAELLEMVRTCMMVQIEGWCPLYTGAGFGQNWYDAKSHEIPVQVQDQIITDGLPWWDGDTSRLEQECNKMITAFTEDSVKEWVLETTSSGEEVKVIVPSVILGYLSNMGCSADTPEESLALYADKYNVPQARLVIPLREDETSSSPVPSITQEDLGSADEVLLKAQVLRTGCVADFSKGCVYVALSDNNTVWNNAVVECVESNAGDQELFILHNDTFVPTQYKVDYNVVSMLIRLAHSLNYHN